MRMRLLQPSSCADDDGRIQRGLDPEKARTRSLRELGAVRLWRKALEAIQAFRHDAVEVNAIHRNALLGVFQKSQQWLRALQELSDRLPAGQVSTDVISFSTAAATCPGWLMPLFFLEWMTTSACRPNVVSFSSSQAAFKDGGGWPRALSLLRAMPQMHGVVPNVVSLSCALKACAAGGRWRQALQLLAGAPARALVPNVVACNAAQSACATTALWALALSTQASTNRDLWDLVSFNTAMDACDKARRWECAVEVLQSASGTSHVPDVARRSDSYGLRGG
ncbi:unnamed protein product [Symbiodinium natans]|uniref:Pentatricopeptide repeat-containing protein, chloroplastic n=1 Tax=Symbiodinium natans TaxID=878477 RepID=A0A812TVE7_9DINO|nr:unnamed protein product [Symbiodinium natans]